MANFYRDIVEIPKRHGCTFVRQGKGDHEIWFSPILERTFSVDHGVVKRHTANGILKDAGISKAF